MQGGEFGVALRQRIILAQQRGMHAGSRVHGVLVRGLLGQACLLRHGLLRAWRGEGLSGCMVRCAGVWQPIRLLLLSAPCMGTPELVSRLLETDDKGPNAERGW